MFREKPVQTKWLEMRHLVARMPGCPALKRGDLHRGKDIGSCSEIWNQRGVKNICEKLFAKCYHAQYRRLNIYSEYWPNVQTTRTGGRRYYGRQATRDILPQLSDCGGDGAVAGRGQDHLTGLGNGGRRSLSTVGGEETCADRARHILALSDQLFIPEKRRSGNMKSQKWRYFLFIFKGQGYDFRIG